MKHYFVLFSGLLLSMAAGAQQAYRVRGTITGLTGEKKAFLSFIEGEQLVRDSVITKNGAFVFEGKIQRPVKAYIMLRSIEPPTHEPHIGDKVEANGIDFYLDKGLTEITGKNITTATIKGSAIENDYASLQWQLHVAADSAYRSMGYPKQVKKEDSVAAFRALSHAVGMSMEAVYRKFVLGHGDSYISFDIVQVRSKVIENPADFELLFDALSPSFKNTDEAKNWAHAIVMAKRLAVGQPAIDFSQPDDKGKLVSSASFKGKYVLIDFWASWCGPCRMEYPFLKKAYAQFKDKNFEIIGVSLDEKDSAWQDAIKSNGFNWTELCDLKGRSNEVAQAYGVTGIPQNFLLDPNGVIIAKDLRGNDLLQKLESVIK